MSTLGTRLKELRIRKGLKQAQVAEIIGVNKKQISAYETDKRQPAYDILIRLASLYRVSTDYLLGYGAKMIDISGLSDSEADLISSLVDALKGKRK